MSQKTKSESNCTPDNSLLLKSIHAFHNDKTQENFLAVITELQSETAYLVVPTSQPAATEKDEKGWSTIKEGTPLSFSTVYDLDGLKVFGVFTSQEKLMAWSDITRHFTAIPAKVVLEIAQENGFGRIVIDSDQDTMFVLDRNTSNMQTEVIKENTEVIVWHPKEPIIGTNKEQLLTAFHKVSSIEEVFHFGITKNNESILILAFVLETVTENSKLAVVSAINEGMKNHALQMPLDIMYLQKSDDWYDTAKKMELFYKK